MKRSFIGIVLAALFLVGWTTHLSNKNNKLIAQAGDVAPQDDTSQPKQRRGWTSKCTFQNGGMTCQDATPTTTSSTSTTLDGYAPLEP